MRNVDAAKTHNAGNTDFTLGWADPFAHLSPERYKHVLGFRPSANKAYGNMPLVGVHGYNGEKLALTVDWTTMGGSDARWAFSTTGGTEGAWQIGQANLLPSN